MLQVSWVGLSWLNTQLRALFTITALVLALTSALTLLNTVSRSRHSSSSCSTRISVARAWRLIR